MIDTRHQLRGLRLHLDCLLSHRLWQSSFLVCTWTCFQKRIIKEMQLVMITLITLKVNNFQVSLAIITIITIELGEICIFLWLEFLVYIEIITVIIAETSDSCKFHFSSFNNLIWISSTQRKNIMITHVCLLWHS